MQDRPDLPALLTAVARFLQKDVQPQIGDKGLGFRVLIAAHLCGVAAAEAAGAEAEDGAQLARLVALLPEAHEGPLPAGESARRALILRLQGELARRLRAGALDDATQTAARAHVLATLREKLRVVSPRFDLSAEIE